MHALDYVVILTYFTIVASYGYWIYQQKKKVELNSKDFFLAEGSLTWWAIGASLIASNISAEQFIGMSGEGFFVGIAISVYEWIAAVSLIIIAVFFMPVYLKNKIYTMPQFLTRRYNETTALIMAVFWLFLYVFVNLTSILYLGSVAINGLVGGDSLHLILIALAFFALVITLGGMKVIGYTDVIQVAVLVIGGHDLVASFDQDVGDVTLAAGRLPDGAVEVLHGQERPRGLRRRRIELERCPCRMHPAIAAEGKARPRSA